MGNKNKNALNHHIAKNKKAIYDIIQKGVNVKPVIYENNRVEQNKIIPQQPVNEEIEQVEIDETNEQQESNTMPVEEIEKLPNVVAESQNNDEQISVDEEKEKYRLGVRDDILAQRQVIDNLVNTNSTKQDENEQVENDDEQYYVIDDGLETKSTDLPENKQIDNENNIEQNNFIENEQDVKPKDEMVDSANNNNVNETNNTDRNVENDEKKDNGTPDESSPTSQITPPTHNVTSSTPTETPVEKKNDKEKNDRNAGNGEKPGEKPKDKPKTELNKHAVRFVGLLLATWAIFLVNPVLMFLALVVFEASFIMKAIELNPDSRLARWTRTSPKTVREKQEEKMIKQQQKMNQNFLTPEEMKELANLRNKSTESLTKKEKQRKSSLERIDKRYSKAKSKFDAINRVYNYDEILVRNATDLVDKQSQQFNEYKNDYLDRLNNNISNREVMLGYAKDGSIQLTEEQMSTLQNEINDLSNFRDKVEAGFVNGIGKQNNEILNRITKEPYNRELCEQIVENVDQKDYDDSLKMFMTESHMRKPLLSSVYDEILKSNEFKEMRKKEINNEKSSVDVENEMKLSM